jgi:ketosteroid isomerase-like protein
MQTTSSETKQELETITRRYLEAVGNKDMSVVQSLLAPEIEFVGPVMKLKGAAAVIEALRRISAVHVRNDVKRVFVDGEETCAVYDFVTDTHGSVATVEWLRIRAGQIQSVQLYYDQLPWLNLRQTLAERASRASAREGSPHE